MPTGTAISVASRKPSEHGLQAGDDLVDVGRLAGVRAADLTASGLPSRSACGVALFLARIELGAPSRARPVVRPSSRACSQTATGPGTDARGGLDARRDTGSRRAERARSPAAECRACLPRALADCCRRPACVDTSRTNGLSQPIAVTTSLVRRASSQRRSLALLAMVAESVDGDPAARPRSGSVASC